MCAQQPQLPLLFSNFVLVSDNAAGHSFVEARNRRRAMMANRSSSCPTDLSSTLANLKRQAVFRPGKHQSFAAPSSVPTTSEPAFGIDEDSSDRWNGCKPKKSTTSTVSLPARPSRRRSMSPESIKKIRDLEAQCSSSPQLQYAKALQVATKTRGLIAPPPKSNLDSISLDSNGSPRSRSRISKAA